MMMDKDNINNKNNDLENSLIQELTAIQTKQASKIRKIPPLQSWQPTRTTPLDIQIRDNGEWWHEGQKMTRQSLVDLFASVLWVEWHDGQAIHYLKTPTDQYQIHVADAPLFINQVTQVTDADGEWIEFGTTHGDVIRLDENHPLYFKRFGKEERVYIDTRFGLTARLMNNVMYHLIQMGKLSQIQENGQNKTVLKLSSGGKIYQIEQHG